MKRKSFIRFFLVIFFSLFLIVFDNNNIKAFDEEFSSQVLSMIKKTEINDIDVNNPYQTKRLIVKSDYNIELMGAIEVAKESSGYYILQYNSEEEAKKAHTYYSSLETVEFVEPDFVFKVENTSSYVSWGANEIGVGDYSNYLIEEIGKNNLNEVIIAVLDTGIDSDHSWFKNRIVNGGKNYSSSNSLGVSYEDVHGHGTHVSGIIVDLTLDNVKILPIKVMNDQGYGYASTVALGIDYVTSLKKQGQKIYAMNLSLGSKSAIGSTSYNIYQEALKKAYSEGIITIAAAGNDGINVSGHTPSNISFVVTVSAVAKSGDTYYRPSWSNYGSYIDVSAPGYAIKSAAVGGGTISMSGTSMAAPHVSAAIALLYSNSQKSYNIDTIEKILDDTSIDIGDVGWDKYFGEGMVNLKYAYATLIDKVEFSNTAKDHSSPFSLSLISDESDAIIYYTLDGTTPSLTNGEVYQEPIIIEKSTEVQAIAYVLSSTGKVEKYSKVNSMNYYFYGNDVDDLYDVSSDGTILKYKGTLTNIVVPKTINNITVTKIGESAFVGTNVTTVTLSSSITKIGDYAFSKVSTLKEIYAPSVTEIGMYAFNECYSLENINDTTFPKLLNIGKYAFYKCYNLNNISLSNVTLVDYWAFAMNGVEAKNLKSINMPSLKIVGEGAFIYCKYLTEISLPNVEIVSSNAFRETDIINLYLPLVKYLGNYSFYSNKKLITINLPNIEMIGDYSFDLCNLINEIEIPKVKQIGESSFNTINIESLSMPLVVEVGAFSFYDCDKLSSLYLPELRYIGYGAFADLDLLEEINLPSIVEIRRAAFENSNNLKKVTLSPHIDVIDKKSFHNISDEVIFSIYGGTTAESFVRESNFSYVDLLEKNKFEYEVNNQEITLIKYVGALNDEIVIPSYIGNLPVTKIANNAFENMNNIYHLKSSTIKEIGENAFANCSNLKTIYIKEITLIKENAFLNCINLTNVEIPAIIEVKDYAFYGCSSLMEIKLPSTLENIGEKSFGYNEGDLLNPNFIFYGYEGSEVDDYAKEHEITIKYIFSSLDSYYYNYYSNNGSQEIYISFVDSHITGAIIIPSSYNGYKISKIGDSAFKNCNLITEIKLPSSIKIIGNEAFYGCSFLNKINLDFVEKIGVSAFENCSSLKEIDMPLVTSISYKAFKNNSSLNLVKIVSASIIEDLAFYNCYELEKVVSPRVERIGYQAFGYNYNLKEIDTSNLKTLGTIYSTGTITGEVFIYCDNLEAIYLPNIVNIGTSIFYNSSITKVVIGEHFEKTYGTPFLNTSELIVYGYEGSGIAKYCEENNQSFTVIKKATIIKDLVSQKMVKGATLDSYIEIEAEGFELSYKWYEINENSSTPIEIDNESDALNLAINNYGKKYFVRIFNWDGSYIDSNICEIIYVESELYEITTNIIGKGEVSPGSKIIVAEGDKLKLVFTPNKGYEISKIYIDERELSSQEVDDIKAKGYLFSNINENHVIKVEFTKIIYKIIATKIGNGTLTPSGEVKAQFEDNQTFYAIADEHNYLENVVVDGKMLTKEEIEIVKEKGYTFINIEDNHTIEFIFALVKQILKIEVVYEEEIIYEEIKVDYGSEYLFKYEPNEGFFAFRVIINDVEMNTSSLQKFDKEGYYIEKVIKDYLIEIILKKQSYVIEVISNEGGIVSPSGNVLVYHGENEQFLFIAKEGYKVSEIIVDEKEFSYQEMKEAIANGYILNNVKENHRIEVNFEKKTYTIDIKVKGEGIVTPNESLTIEHGLNQKIIIEAAIYHHVKEIIIDGITLKEEEMNKVIENGYEFLNINDNHTIEVEFSKDTYWIEVKITGNGFANENSNVYVEHGSNKHLLFTPEEGHYISKVIVNQKSVAEEKLLEIINEGYLFENVTRNQKIEVVFQKKKYLIQVVNNEYGQVSPSNNVYVEHGNNKHFSFYPLDGYEITSVFINKISVSIAQLSVIKNEGYTFEFVDKDYLLEVTFEKKEYHIKVDIEGNGKINIENLTKVKHGDDLEIKITPDENYHIKELIINNESMHETMIEQILKVGYKFKNIKSDHDIFVVFEINKFKISIESEGNGKVVPGNEIIAEYGENIILKFKPDEGYILEEVIVDGNALNQEQIDEVIKADYVFNSVNENHSVKVKFNLLVYKIMASSSGNGSINPSGKILIQLGQNYSFIFKAEEDSYIKDVIVDGLSKGAISSYVFRNVEGSHTIDVVFETKKYDIVVNIEGKGTIECEKGLKNIEYGSSRSILITPDKNHKIEKVLVNNREAKINENILNIAKIKNDIEINITFVEIEEKEEKKSGMSCSKNDGEGNIMDLLFMIFSIMIFAIPKKKVLKR